MRIFPEQRLMPDKNWSLFLDRDGVINERLVDEYVLNPGQFSFIEGVKESIAFFSEVFGRIMIVTNQQGIGRGYMTENDLQTIHKKMLLEIENEGGRINRIYHCPDLKGSKSLFRKPAIGMALRAKKDFPEIDFKRSVMAGDSITDMVFGKRMKMVTVFIGNDKKMISMNHHLIDFGFSSLEEFASYLKNK